MKNKFLWILFTAMYHILSWGSVLVYAGIKYGAVIMTHSVLAVFGFAAILAIVLILHSLKETAEHGYGLARRVARSVRKIVPMLALTAFVLLVNINIANFFNIILFTLIANIIAQPFGILGYRFGPQYIEDTGANRILKKL